MSWVIKFAKHSEALKEMSFTLWPFITEIAFCDRQGDFSTSVCFNDIAALRDYVGDIPSEVLSASTTRYGFNLESLRSGNQRFYVNGQADGETVRAYHYNAQNQLTHWKSYKKSSGQYPILVDRYNASGEIISADEPEESGDSSFWTGSSEIIDTASGHDVIYLRKVNANQSYMRIMK